MTDHSNSNPILPELADPFVLEEQFLRSRGNAKWNLYGSDVLPAFVAEMDFAIAEPIQNTLRPLIEKEDYGYPMRAGGRPDQLVIESFGQRMERKFHWRPNPGSALVLADLVQGTFAAIMAFCEPGEGVILQVPCYPPFREAITTLGRRLIPLIMRDDGRQFRFDLDEIAGAIDARTRILLLCNPHNPTGRVFLREELMQLAELAIERDLIVISDEIHADLAYPGAHHIPFASLSEEIAARTVTLYSATKSFNIPGLRCAVIHFGSRALQERFQRQIPARLLGSVSAIGIEASLAAWSAGEPWLQAAMNHLQRARDHMLAMLKAELPQISCHAPEATYLAWLDCSLLDLTGSAYKFFLEEARIGFSPGESFEPACGQFVRFNFATSRAILDQILERMIGAVRRRDGS